MEAKICAAAIRNHWQIENCNHHVRDVTFEEDKSRIRTQPLIMARLRSIALFIQRYNGAQTSQEKRYKALGEGAEAAAINVAQANRAQSTARRSIADLMIATTDAQNKDANTSLQTARKDFIDYLDAAAKAQPTRADEYNSLKARGLEIIDKSCAASISAGMRPGDQGAAVTSQALYLKECGAAFPPLLADMKAKVIEVVREASKQYAGSPKSRRARSRRPSF